MTKVKGINRYKTNPVKRSFISKLILALNLIVTFSLSLAKSNGIDEAISLSLKQAIQLGLSYDPWLKGNELTQYKVESMAISAGQLPDPMVSLGIANIGADNFDFSQEPMTQLKVGFTQKVPRGKSLSLRREKLNTLGKQYPFQRDDRRALLVLKISQLWLSAFQEQESIRLIEKDRSLFEHLVDVAEASYSSVRGKARQQDLVRAQLELTRLEDRLTVLNQSLEANLKQLSEFVSDYFVDEFSEYEASSWNENYVLTGDLPSIQLLKPLTLDANLEIPSEELFSEFMNHPAVNALDMRIKAEEIGVELAKQKFKPAWGFNTSYGYRADAENNMSRADLFSVGVTFDLPLFTKNRQDQDLKAAVYSLDSIETQKWQLLRKMKSAFETHKTQLTRLIQRQQLYESQLLPQMNEQAEASLSAYTNDDGDFAEVVRARIAELNAQIDALRINVSIQKTKVQLNYLFMDDIGQLANIIMENSNDQ